MSARGRQLFDGYVSKLLTHPDLVALSIESHAHNLTSTAHEAHIPIAEITEEVGPLGQALALAMKGLR